MLTTRRGTPGATRLVARFEGSPNFSTVIHLRSDAEVAPALDDRAALMVVKLAPDFSRRAAAWEPAG